MYYRRVGRLIDVLDTAGSLSDGGRYNIGGAQTSSTAVKEFGKIGRKKSALYICEDLKGVRKEYGDEGMAKSTAVTYEIKAATSDALNLICFIDTPRMSRSGADPVDEFNYLSTGSIKLCRWIHQVPQVRDWRESIRTSLS